MNEIKQALLGFSCLYPGISTLLTNLLIQGTPLAEYHESWEEQYADGQGNGIFCLRLNPCLAGLHFSEVAWFCYLEFQVTVLAVVTDLHGFGRQILINPGNVYHVKDSDDIICISHSSLDLEEMSLYKKDHFQKVFTEMKEIADVTVYSVERVQEDAARHTSAFENVQIGKLNTPYEQPDDQEVPLCFIVDKDKKLSIDESLIDDASHLSQHIIICSSRLNMLGIVCVLRSKELEKEGLVPILILCENRPTADDWSYFNQFPCVYIMVGDPTCRSILNRAGIQQAKTILLTDLRGRTEEEGFGDTVELITYRQLCRLLPSEKKLSILVDLANRSSVQLICDELETSQPIGAVHDEDMEESAISLLQSRDEFLQTSAYACGRVVVPRILDAVLAQTWRVAETLNLVRLLCGLRYV